MEIVFVPRFPKQLKLQLTSGDDSAWAFVWKRARPQVSWTGSVFVPESSHATSSNMNPLVAPVREPLGKPNTEAHLSWRLQ